MDCKNCGASQRTDYNYCPSCGAKVIRNRLTFRNLWYDFTERYFNLDNTFIRTFLHLFSKPELVIDGYISGVRRKYLNPISYLGIAVAISGLLFFVLRKYFLDQINLDVFDSGLDPEVSKKIMSATLDFSTFIFILYIPVLAFAGWLTFNRKKYIFPECIITGIYTLAHYNISIFPLSLIILISAPEKYISFSPIFLGVMVGYGLYVVHRLNKMPFWRSIHRSFAFLFLFLLGYIGVSVFLNMILLAIGDLSLQDFIPKKI